jgi:four helix bundle protein
MNQESREIKSFTDLDAWKEGHKLVIRIYRITKDFPREDAFGLVSQMRRAAVSVTSNIAEGFSRQSYKEKAQFYTMAQGSITELQNQLLIARDVRILAQLEFDQLAYQSTKVQKITNGLIKMSKTMIRDS